MPIFDNAKLKLQTDTSCNNFELCKGPHTAALHEEAALLFFEHFDGVEIPSEQLVLEGVVRCYKLCLLRGAIGQGAGKPQISIKLI